MVRERAGILAGTARVLTSLGLDVTSAQVATWPDGAVFEVFEVQGASAPDADDLAADIDRVVAEFDGASPLPDVTFRFDHRASPWHSVCEMDAAERPGLLADVAELLRAAGVTVRSASARTHEGRAFDIFEITTTDGHKLDTADEERIRSFARSGATVAQRRFRSPTAVART